VQTLGDIRGRAFAFGDQASTSSHLAPRAHIQKRTGLVGDRDHRAVHLGTHDAMARAVQAGQVPADALSEQIFRTLLQRGIVEEAKLRVLDHSDPIPNYPLVMQGDLAPALKQAIRDAFLDLKDPALLRNFRVEGFAPTDNAAYDVLREMARILNLDLSRAG
jgi:phosphonate transport system substrate-binding protein